MFTFIHAQIISKDGFDFQNQAVSWVKENYPETILFDFDNWSSAEIFQYATQLTKEDSNTIILIEKKAEEPAHSIATWLEKILKHQVAIKIFIRGDDKFFKILANKFPNQIMVVQENTAWQDALKLLWNYK